MNSNFEFVNQAFRDCRQVELRHQDASGKWTAGLFDNPRVLRETADAHAGTGNLYLSLNQIGPRLVGNRLAPARCYPPIRNCDVTRIRRIPLDFDPIRPSGVASTDAELGGALRARDAVVSVLRGMGFPLPAVGVSGNGAHAVFRCNIVPGDDWNYAVEILYRGIEAAFSDLFADCGVHFDTVVRNPGRIWRLYGFWNRKGDPTAERPHRMADITIPSTGWDCVSPAQLTRILKLWEPRVTEERHRERVTRNQAAPVGTGDYSTLDVVAWLQSHDLYIKPLSVGAHAVRCPWQAEHSGKGGATETVVFEAGAGKWAGFYCHHAHCEGRGIRQLMAHLGDADAFCARPFTPQGGTRHG